ncbi:cadherin domain-containing protein [Caenimonas sp. SL110]|uniref:cadherin domain-containing protein n=1 Tax=Caenimonas sp. SL110 TaxID=1450524 RepID=UPI0006530267|nr:cadherin domain-containing protein [Caenimonas sp. SL110]
MRARKVKIAENAPVDTPIYSFDHNGASGLSYALSGTDAAFFKVSSDGVVTLRNPADYEVRTLYSFDLLIITSTHTLTQSIRVGVKNLNDEAPVFTSGGKGFVAEGERVVYRASTTDADQPFRQANFSLTGQDAHLLEISRSGVVRLLEPADHETRTSYDFNVVANDGVNTTVRAVHVTVDNANDTAPVFTSGSTGSVTENAPTSTAIYTATTTDADGLGAPDYSLSGADAALLNISSEGVVTLKASPDYEVKASYEFNVIADDGEQTATQAVVVSVINVAPTLAITSSADLLQDGESATITFTFSEDPGTSFIAGDIAVSGGTLTGLTGTGLVRTATFTAATSANLSTGGKVTVLPGNFTDLAGLAGVAAEGTGALAPSVSIATVFNEVLFVGNSATFGRADPVMSYNTWDAQTNPGGVHDLTSPDRGGNFANQTGANLYEPHNWGGVPGLVDMFADQVGLSWDVSLSTRNAATLRGHYLNTSPAAWDLRGNISGQEWDIVVLQDQTDEPLPGGSGSITFAPGSSTATLIVTPTSDALKEYDETLSLTLSADAAYRVGTSSAVTTTIQNDDPTAPVTDPALPTITLVAAQGSAAEDGAGNLVFTFTRTGATTNAITINFAATRDGSTAPSITADLEHYNIATGAFVGTSATGSSAYRFSSGGGFETSGSTAAPTTTGSISFTSSTGTIVIPAGQTSASITLDPKSDATIESDESVKLTLSSNANYNVGTAGEVKATIVNDDFAVGTDLTLPNVTLSLSSAASAYESAGQSLIYTFTRSGSTTSALTVKFKEDGTATYFSGEPTQSDFGISTTGATAASLETTSGSNADIPAFEQYATLIENYIHTGAADGAIAANPNASEETDVYLYATWARPDMVAGAWDMLTEKILQPNGAYTGGTISQSDTKATAYYLTLEEMSADLTAAYTHLAETNTDFVGVAPVSTAFMAAVQAGLAIRDPYTETETDSVSTGQINLWFDDNLHASKYGSYLAGLTLFETMTGLDARVLGAGDVVAQDLGIDAATAVALQQVASATLGFDQTYHWSAPGAVTDLGGTHESATLATAGAFTFVDAAFAEHSVSVQSQDGNLGTLTAQIRSDGHAGQVNWLYTVNNQVADPLLAPGAGRMEYFTVTLDDGNGHSSVEIIGVSLTGQLEI